jgi:hypothetical protein
MDITASDHDLRDALYELIDRARQAQSECKSRAKDQEAAAYSAGRAFAYYEVVSYLLLQLEAFGLSRDQYDVPQDFNSDTELQF